MDGWALDGVVSGRLHVAGSETEAKTGAPSGVKAKGTAAAGCGVLVAEYEIGWPAGNSWRASAWVGG